MSMASSTPLIVMSYNCHGYNSIKSSYISSLISKCNFLLIQEHWLADEQLSVFGKDHANISYTGTSGFNGAEVLAGRPYGGCAILWQANLRASISPLDVNNCRVCAVRVSFESVNILLVNIYMPYEDGDDKMEEFVCVLSAVEELINSNNDCHVVIGGDFNVDFCRNWTHTAILSSFCDDAGLMPIIRHANCHIDYTYNFNMNRFSILDHFILSGTLFEDCVSDASVLHDIDNLSDHDPVCLSFCINVDLLASRQRVYTPKLSWPKAGLTDLNNYRLILSHNLQAVHPPVGALLCMDTRCRDPTHHVAVGQYAEAISAACVSAAISTIPVSCDRHVGSRRIPGWNERVEPLRQKSLFWHNMWADCGRPKNGAVADCMRRSRASYHYAVRQVKKDEDCIVREHIANALIDDPTRNFWAEVRKIRSTKACSSLIVDGCTDEASIAQLFALKYRSLYTSVPFDQDEMQTILNELDVKMQDGGLCQLECFSNHEVLAAIKKLKAHKNDGRCNGLSTDHLINAGPDLSYHIAFLFTCMVIHGSVPDEFGLSTILPIPKKQNINAADSNNFRGIALSSVFCKLLDNIILDKFYDKLCTSDHQFGFKPKCSTNMCTMVLKETVSYYITNHSSVYCTFLDASKAFDRVRYCKLFRLLVRRGLPACIVRILIVLYTSSQVRVLWAGLYSDYFSVLNGVKQGGVISPVLFCIYIDDLLIRLASSGVGCFIGLNFVGALAYADDISLLAPNPSAMRKLLGICDSFAAEFDIQFNPDKSKFIVVAANKRRHFYKDMCNCSFSIGARCIENVDKFPHLGHIITSSFDDLDDILHRRNSFVGQTNHVLCFF